MADKRLRDRLIGAWSLVSYEERPVDGSPSFFPMRTNPKGIIMYTPDGFIHVDEEKQHLTHSIFISLFPNWIGQTQPRVVRNEGDRLFLLGTASPISSAGKTVNSHLAWRRADASTIIQHRN